MRRKSFLSVRKGMAVALTAAVVMSQSMMVYAQTVTATDGDTVKVEDGVSVSDNTGDTTGVRASSDISVESDSHETSVTVDNGISVTENKNEGSNNEGTGISATSSGSSAKTEVTVNSGAVTVTGAG
ncbi:hypothetical protein BXO88_16105, partial [Oribacterium sp. C9]|uniref:hypothetical protein n=1 Tax=Oribacterium sp. C9 TaxID=1943579 RepID=UPI0009D59CC3